MSAKKPWLTRLHDSLQLCLEPSSGAPGMYGWRPRIATSNHMRFLVFKTRTHDGREVRTPMTPEQAIDLGTALVKAGMAMGMANLRNADGWIVNEAKPGQGWRTGTASNKPDEIDWSRV